MADEATAQGEIMKNAPGAAASALLIVMATTVIAELTNIAVEPSGYLLRRRYRGRAGYRASRGRAQMSDDALVAPARTGRSQRHASAGQDLVDELELHRILIPAHDPRTADRAPGADDLRLEIHSDHRTGRPSS